MGHLLAHLQHNYFRVSQVNQNLRLWYIWAKYALNSLRLAKFLASRRSQIFGKAWLVLSVSAQA